MKYKVLMDTVTSAGVVTAPHILQRVSVVRKSDGESITRWFETEFFARRWATNVRRLDRDFAARDDIKRQLGKTERFEV